MAAINYIQAAVDYDPLADLYSPGQGTVYEDLVWVSTPIDKSVLEEQAIISARRDQISILSSALSEEFTSGFLSDTLVTDTFRKYDSSIQGQILIVGATVSSSPSTANPSGLSYLFPNSDPDTGEVSYDLHTHDQLTTVLETIGTFSQTLVVKLQGLIVDVYSAIDSDPHVTLDLIYDVTWV